MSCGKCPQYSTFDSSLLCNIFSCTIARIHIQVTSVFMCISSSCQCAMIHFSSYPYKVQVVLRSSDNIRLLATFIRGFIFLSLRQIAVCMAHYCAWSVCIPLVYGLLSFGQSSVLTLGQEALLSDLPFIIKRQLLSPISL